MSETITLARPYARAAFEFAAERGALDQWAEVLGMLGAVALAPEIAPLLSDPAVTPKRRADILLEVAGGEVDEHGRNFVHLLAANRRLTLLPDIAAQYEVLKAEHEKAVQVEAISAFPLSAQQVGVISENLERKLQRKVNVEARVDESLIGGVLIRAGDKVIDGTIRGRLERLAESMHS